MPQTEPGVNEPDEKRKNRGEWNDCMREREVARRTDAVVSLGLLLLFLTKARQGEQSASGFAFAAFKNFRFGPEAKAPEVTRLERLLAGGRRGAGANPRPVSAAASQALAADCPHGRLCGFCGLRIGALPELMKRAGGLGALGHQEVGTAHAGHAELTDGFGRAQFPG